jgi:opacity protein-like surface antigen
MKNFILSLVVLLIVFSRSFAQDGLPYSPMQRFHEGFHIGAHAFPGHSSIASQNNYGFAELDPGFFFAFGMGLKGGLRFSENWSVFAEYNFSRIGGSWKGDEAGISTTREVRVEYWQIPLLLRYNWTENPRFYVTAGPMLHLLKTAQHLYEPAGNEITGRPGLNGDITERFKENVLGFMLGAGIEAPFSERLYGVFGVRFSFTPGDINHEDFRINNLQGEYHPSRIYFPAIEIGLGYIFPFI